MHCGYFDTKRKGNHSSFLTPTEVVRKKSLGLQASLALRLYYIKVQCSNSPHRPKGQGCRARLASVPQPPQNPKMRFFGENDPFSEKKLKNYVSKVVMYCMVLLVHSTCWVFTVRAKLARYQLSSCVCPSVRLSVRHKSELYKDDKT